MFEPGVDTADAGRVFGDDLSEVLKGNHRIRRVLTQRQDLAADPVGNHRGPLEHSPKAWRGLTMSK